MICASECVYDDDNDDDDDDDNINSLTTGLAHAK